MKRSPFLSCGSRLCQVVFISFVPVSALLIRVSCLFVDQSMYSVMNGNLFITEWYLPDNFQQKAGEGLCKTWWRRECQGGFNKGSVPVLSPDNEVSILSLFLNVRTWRAKPCASVPPPNLAISSNRLRIHNAHGRQRGWTCSGSMSAQWQLQKPWVNNEEEVKVLSKQHHLIAQIEWWWQYSPARTSWTL